jgi:hypothetical protein
MKQKTLIEIPPYFIDTLDFIWNNKYFLPFYSEFNPWPLWLQCKRAEKWGSALELILGCQKGEQQPKG